MSLRIQAYEMMLVKAVQQGHISHYQAKKLFNEMCERINKQNQEVNYEIRSKNQL